MSIKKQFLFLSIIITIVPILCLISFLTHYYVKSSDRLLIEGYKEIREMDASQFTKNDWDMLYETIDTLPLDVEATLLDENNTVLISSIPDFTLGKQIQPREMWELVNGESDKYFYQFTSPPLENRKITLLTRTSRERKKTETNKNLWITLFSIIVLFITICIVLIIFISTTIFKSIILLETKTQQIANGDLSEMSDITHDLNKSNEITSTLQSLEKMRVSLLEAQNRKNKFIMGISHDLRTPVAIIKGYTEAISDGIISDPDEVKTSLDLIGTKTTQLESMIDTLINFMKLNSTELRQKLLPSSITNLIKNFAKESQVTANVFKRNIIININLEKDILVPLDEQLASRAFQNLFSNALRYTNDGDEIEISSYIENNKIFLKIRDTGIGMAQKDLANIFDLFYRATNSRREEGMGIGLSVVKNIIETHGWTIDVESELNVGSTFTIQIPFENN